MKKILIIFFIINFNNLSFGSIKENIINNLQNTNNLSFDFEQNINGKIEKGSCIIEYPKKIFCNYDNTNNKTLVSNGKSLVIKTNSGSYYRYSLERTPLNYILDKNFLIDEIQNLEEKIIDDKFINFKILKNDNEINIFFNSTNYTLIGWQTLDIYQNLSITYISSLKINQLIEKNIFKLPASN
ncbi:outer-membrane lipoprotein carrier protein LolA [Candidatus Pelagibacter sp.]|jgi:outer membrane lipoprotein-sorting protein|nr:outer-membrane lipoprotein carrier protein LolA [Candidatus Pelagibacter sp.]